MSQKIVSIRFLNGNSPSAVSYDFLAGETVVNYLKARDVHRVANKEYPTFKVRNTEGNNYNDANVIIVSIRSLSARENCRNLKTLASVSYSKPIKVNLSTYPSDFDFTNETAAEYLAREQSTYEKVDNKNERNKTSMKIPSIFSRMNLDYGKDPSIKFSLLGPAFPSDTGYLSFDPSTGEYTDVSGLTIEGMDGFCFKMPTPTNQITVGDFILHGGKWVRVREIFDDGHFMAEKIGTHEVVEAFPVKNMFGFNFTTKLVNFGEGVFGNLQSGNPMQNMLMLSALSGEDGDMEDMLPMLLFGGAMGNQQNPMMGMLMMKALKGKNSVGGKDEMFQMMLMAQMMQNGGTFPPTMTAAQPK